MYHTLYPSIVDEIEVGKVSCGYHESLYIHTHCQAPIDLSDLWIE